MGLTVLPTPVQAAQANAFCERLVGTIRCECFGFLIPLTEWHLRDILTRWIMHYFAAAHIAAWDRDFRTLRLIEGRPRTAINQIKRCRRNSPLRMDEHSVACQMMALQQKEGLRGRELGAHSHLSGGCHLSIHALRRRR